MSVFVSPPGLRGRDPFSKLLLTGDSLTDVSGSKVMGHPYARYALSLNGSSQYAQTSSVSDLNFQAGDFTIRGWFHFTSTTGTQLLVNKWNATNNKKEFVLQFNASDGLYFYYSTDGSSAGIAYASWIPPVNAWYYICVVRSSGYVSFFVNSVQIGATQAASGSFYATDTPVVIGANIGGGYYFAGYVCDVEIAKGVARSGAAPSSPLVADAHTSALFRVNDSGTVLDDSGTGKTWTLYGAPQAATAHPVTNAGAGVTIADTASYYPNLAAAGYFDGSSSLFVADDESLEIGSQDFTIEILYCQMATISSPVIACKASATAASWCFARYDATYTAFLWSTNGTSWNVYVTWAWQPTIGKTHRLVISRSGSVLRFYADGVKIGSDQSCSAAFINNDTPVCLGTFPTASFSSFQGYLADFRLSIGTNRGYTGDTIPVPTSPLEADAYTRLLIPMRTPGGVFVDASGTGKTVTTSGSPVVANMPPAGKALNMSKAYLYLPDNADFRLAADATTDFTIDAWVRGSGCICSLFDGINGWAVILHNNVYGLTLNYGNSLASYLACSDTPDTSIWNHCAVVRRNGTLFIYRNGALKASGTLGAVTLPSTVFRVGAYYWSSSYSYFTGQIANLRVTTGLARWTRDFTPPVRPY